MNSPASFRITAIGRRRRPIMLSGGAAIAVLALTPWAGACAQSTSSPEAEAGRAGGYDEIIVSARRRDERLVDVPGSIAAMSGDQLEANGVADATDLLGGVPSLYFSSSVVTPTRDTTYLVIRGVGANSGGEPSAATFVDGVYLPSLGFDIGFLELERVEVLRGPQGSLFGRNTEAGALNIITRRPGEEFHARAMIEGDEFESFKFQGSVSGPVSEDLSLGLSALASTTGGYITNTTLGADAGATLGGGKTFNSSADDYEKFAARFAARYLGFTDSEIYLTLDWSRSDGDAAFPGAPHGCGCYFVENEFQLPHVAENWGAALNVDRQFGDIALTSITGYRRMKNRGPFDFDGGADFTGNFYDLRTAQRLISQEFKLASDHDGAFNWTGGVYLFKESNLQDRDFTFPDLDTIFAGIDVTSQIIENKRKGVSVYGQGILQLTDRLELSGGVRYSVEEVNNRADVDFVIPLIAFAVDFVDTPSSSFDGITGSASLSYHLTDNFLAYANFAQGFKAGGYQKTTATQASNLPFDSERSTNYELGLKGSLIDGLLDVELAAFYIELTEQQLQTVVLVDGIIPVSAIDNAGESHTQGFEARLVAKPAQGLTIDANAGYVDTEYDRYVNEDGVDRAGDAFPFVPKWTAGLHAEYRTPVSNSLDAVFGAAYRHVGSYYTGTGTSVDPFFDIDSYDRVDVRVGLASDRWSATLFADNLFDSHDVTYVWNAYFFAGNSRNFDQVLPPRRIGARITAEF